MQVPVINPRPNHIENISIVIRPLVSLGISSCPYKNILCYAETSTHKFPVSTMDLYRPLILVGCAKY